MQFIYRFPFGCPQHICPRIFRKLSNNFWHHVEKFKHSSLKNSWRKSQRNLWRKTFMKLGSVPWSNLTDFFLLDSVEKRNFWKNYVGIFLNKSIHMNISEIFRVNLLRKTSRKSSWSNYWTNSITYSPKNPPFIVRFLEVIPIEITGGAVTVNSEKVSAENVEILQDFFPGFFQYLL